jgi:hypothetical protein
MLEISLNELCKWGSKKRRKASWIVKRFGKYRRKSKLNSEKIWKIWKKPKLVMISPLCTSCHNITVILLNVELNTINLTLYLQRHIPKYLSIYIFIRIIDFIQFFASYFHILMSFKKTLLNTLQIAGEHNIF